MFNYIQSKILSNEVYFDCGSHYLLPVRNRAGSGNIPGNWQNSAWERHDCGHGELAGGKRDLQFT